MWEWLFALLERLQERYLEPRRLPRQRLPGDLSEVWLLYRIERLERKIKWLFLLGLVVPIVEAMLFLLWLIVSAAT